VDTLFDSKISDNLFDEFKVSTCMNLFEHADPDNILPVLGQVYYYPYFFDRELSDFYFKRLIHEIEWKQEPIRLFGKQVMQPRLTALYGNTDIPYGYSGIEMQSHDWLGFLKEIREKIEKTAQIDFSHVLLNYYRNGQDSMGWHRDNEKVLGTNPIIASVSFGVTRKFQFRRYHDKSMKKEITLEHGSLLLMTGETQHHWEHQLPKTRLVKGERVNLTFRKIYP
jgi:alkylated DNA repair dioxygenase AlkB